MVDIRKLSHDATQGEWEALGSIAGCVYTSTNSIQQGNPHNSDLACALVNAYRAGRLVENVNATKERSE